MLWAAQILPALLPCSIVSGLLLSSGVFAGKRKSTEWFIIFCGFVFGFPMGSKLAADFCSQDLITKKRAEFLCGFTNNMSPIFVSTYVLDSQLKCPELIGATFGLLYGVPLVYGLCGLWLIRRRFPYTIRINKPAKNFDLNMQIIDAGILKSFETMIRLCGYIVIFSILSHMFMAIKLPNESLSPIIAAIMECTNGIAAISRSSMSFEAKYLLILGSLSFGGISGIAQTRSMIKKTGLSIVPYIWTRLIFAVTTMGLAALFIRFIL